MQRKYLTEWKRFLQEDSGSEPGDVELGKWAMSAKLPQDMSNKIDSIKASPQYKDGNVDYARVVADLGREQLLKLYNQK